MSVKPAFLPKDCFVVKLEVRDACQCNDIEKSIQNLVEGVM